MFNNCKGRKHPEIYQRNDAFYDLGMTGSQANLATNIAIGEQCVVASYADKARQKVVFKWFEFIEVVQLPDKQDNRIQRVFCGKILRAAVTLPKPQAASQLPYSQFFNIKGDFKQVSVIVLYTPKSQSCKFNP